VDEGYWKDLQGRLQISGVIKPVSDNDLDKYERKRELRLPVSYKYYCHVFGAGVLARWFFITVPNYLGKFKKRFDLDSLNLVKDSLEWQTYSNNPEQFSRALIFAEDEATALYFWDPDELTDTEKNEYAIYALFRDWTTKRLANTFDEFIDVCLGRHQIKIYQDEIYMEFRAAIPKKGGSKKSS
jgi:hypothetical protein